MGPRFRGDDGMGSEGSAVVRVQAAFASRRFWLARMDEPVRPRDPAIAFRFLDLLWRHGLHRGRARQQAGVAGAGIRTGPAGRPAAAGGRGRDFRVSASGHHVERSEEHTSELQSLMRLSYAVFCLKTTIIMYVTTI